MEKGTKESCLCYCKEKSIFQACIALEKIALVVFKMETGNGDTIKAVVIAINTNENEKT